jgi:hypothetical protein
MKSILDFLKDHSGILVPFLGAYFLVYGVTEMTTFYHEFGIEITDYFYVSDFLTVILGDLPLLVVFSFGLTYGFYLVDRFTTIPAEGLIERKRLLRIWIWDIISVILICIGILVLVAVAFESNYLITAICLYLIVGVSMFGFSNHWVKRLILHLVLAFPVLAIANGYFDAKAIKTKYKTYGSTVVIADSVFVSDSSRYFIGNTSAFVFIYDTRDTSVCAVKMDEVKAISTKKR